ncbi:ABC-type multidrug transport system, ATPase component [Desulfosporosinus orientis DSM 765]|uniref:ABC-type multidrug transport system, ATPase component n=1 Tax=Desulfosporosinus orientis (strain ATCC 19365 / DSM 765 / NCIMB 8382 / VKM B-1628 / Singapore I) TaxID=768706 RepID=G7WG52_DESOD|nr:ATP-binding cassette domain-containing protein [Desulfosporosinus orientis]AET70146.1 ABC-type multidrug transport system, ATPase component [Desulfosporosinus orientis DSM 765]
MSIIHCQDVSKSFGKTPAINQLSFDIEENTITGLIGRNGAGKTTLLKMLAGLSKPTSGHLQVHSQNPFNSLEVSAKTILIDDAMTFPDSFRLADILAEMAPFYANWSSSLANALFAYFSFNPNQRHGNLSKGSKSTFNNIIGISSRCPLTIFDEPTNGMDSAVRKDFYKALLKDYLEYPRTILLSSHLLSELGEILEDVLLIHLGAKVLHLPMMDLKEAAIGLRGNTQILHKVIQGKELIYEELFAKNNRYVVIDSKQLTDQEIRHLRQGGLEVLPVSPEDLCIYLTTNHKGGIDDVFKQ